MGNESRCGHKNAPIEHDEFPNWIQGCPMKTKDSSERIVRLQRFTALFSESRDKFAGKSKKLIQACQDLQWNHDTRTPSSLRNKRSDRNGRPQSDRRDRCRTCTKWTHFFTTRWPIARHLIKNVMGKNLTDRSFLFGTLFGCVPIIAKDKSRKDPPVWKENAERMIVGLCTTCGKNKVGQATHWFAYFEGLQETEATTKTPSHFALNVGLVSFFDSW